MQEEIEIFLSNFIVILHKFYSYSFVANVPLLRLPIDIMYYSD